MSSWNGDGQLFTFMNHCNLNRSPPLNHMNARHTLKPHFLEIHSSIILQSGLFATLAFPTKIFYAVHPTHLIFTVFYHISLYLFGKNTNYKTCYYAVFPPSPRLSRYSELHRSKNSMNLSVLICYSGWFPNI
jgi:hypothetical protein